MASNLGKANDCSSATCSTWGNIELRISNSGSILWEKGHQEA